MTVEFIPLFNFANFVFVSQAGEAFLKKSADDLALMSIKRNLIRAI